MPNPHFPKLNDANYVDWHYMMAATLIEKDLWDVVDGSLTCPVSSPNHKAVKTFVMKHQLVHGQDYPQHQGIAAPAHSSQ